MVILPGTRLGPYEILAAVGAGGMGEVYRARDTRLNRDVALKVLPEVFSADRDRMSRFEREARVLAALNHSHIAAIYGLEESNSVPALVMELVEGPTLADRIVAGPIPLDEALPIAKQIAEALEYAHDHGVIHRDLKPANIKVMTDGTVKVLDFGLAKALLDEPVAADPRDSPTLSMAATMAGVILGTAAYMSPEQAKGKPVDRRTDIWAFGCVLYEMLTGKPLYTGETATEILASIIKEAPPLERLPSGTPSAIRTLLRRCLDKDPRQRLRDMGEARIAIEHAGATSGSTITTERKTRERLAWSVAGVLLLGLAVTLALGAWAYFRGRSDDARTIRFFVSAPETWNVTQLPGPEGRSPAPVAVSPDGNRVAFVAVSTDGRTLLWVHSLDALTAQSLAGSDGASSPFWSPDSRFLGFFANGKLKKIDVSGGPPITLCDVPNGFGGAWNRDGVIIFAATITSALQRVAASGGVPTAATVLGPGETRHSRPFFLPDGRHFLHHVLGGTRTGIYLSSLDSAERKFLLSADAGNVIYSQGHLLFLHETTLMAQPFDVRRLVLSGDAFPIAEQIETVGGSPPNGFFSASENGVLAYQTGTAQAGFQLVWFDRTGKRVGVLGDPAPYADLELSPDGKRASVSILAAGLLRDIWLYDVVRGLRTRYTFGPVSSQTSIWSPDGSRIVFNLNGKHLELHQKASNGAGAEEVLLEDNLSKTPVSWSRDGRFILYASSGGPTGYDLFVLPLFGDRKPFPFLQTQFNDFPGQFSPDGRWVVYTSDESGKHEAYVAPFPGPGGRGRSRGRGGGGPGGAGGGPKFFFSSAKNSRGGGGKG